MAHEVGGEQLERMGAGLQRVLPRDHLPYAPPAGGVQALDAVWEPLDALDPLAKQAMVEAITAAIAHDGRVSVAATLGAGNATGNAVAMTVHSAARHSFDQIDIAKTLASPYTPADKDAQIAADTAVMDRLATIFSN